MRWPSPTAFAGLSHGVARHLAVWRAAWREERLREPGAARSRREAEFLPAVLEIQESPPSPVGRAVAGLIMAAFAFAILWASFSSIDIVAVARGKIIPSGYSKVIQPLESGVISAIHVRDGQTVKAGEVLIELDATVNAAEQAKLSNEYLAARVEIARLQALLAGRDRLEAPAGADPKFVELQAQLLRDQLAEQQARLEAVRQQVEQRKAALDGTKAEIAKLEATVPMLTQKAAAFKKLLQDQYVAEMQYLDAEQLRVEAVQTLASLRKKLVQDQAALAEARQNYERLRSDIQQSRMAELTANETKAASLAQEVVKAGQRTGLQRLTSPIDGVVQQLAVHTVGGVVTPAQQLLIVVPNDHPLEVEAWVENKDIGFVKEGQPVEIKVETFPFTVYGTITGRIVGVSDDAVPLEQGGLAYAARVSMDRAEMAVEGRTVRLSPGMAVTAEIKTGQRRVIEFVLSPLLKYTQESARER